LSAELTLRRERHVARLWWGLLRVVLLHLVLHDLLILAVSVHPVLRVLHSGNLIAHVEAELTHLPLLDEQTVFSLAFSSSSADTVSSRFLFWGKLLV
jgi:hypothetical protein